MAALAALASLGFHTAAADHRPTDGNIRVGQFVAQTGSAAALGDRKKASIQAHFMAFEALIEEDTVFALIGLVSPPTALAALPAIKGAAIPLIGSFTGAQAPREPLKRNIPHVLASDFDANRAHRAAGSYGGNYQSRGVVPKLIEISAYKSIAALIQQARTTATAASFSM